MAKSLRGWGLSVDLDGTLYRVPRWKVGWRLRHQRALLRAMLDAREKIRMGAPTESEAAFVRLEAEFVAEQLGLTSLEQVCEKLQGLKQALAEAATHNVRLYPGVRECLEWAHAHEIKIAVFSDYAPERKLESLGLADFPWSGLVGADRVGSLKPHNAGFAAVSDQLELTPGRIVHVGDREELDVKGALNAGMRAWLFYAGTGSPPTVGRGVVNAWEIAQVSTMFAEEH